MASIEGRKEKVMDNMTTNTEYILRFVLSLINKCKTLEELRIEIEKTILREKE